MLKHLFKMFSEKQFYLNVKEEINEVLRRIVDH